MTMYLSIIELNGTFVHRQNNNKRGKSLEEGRTTKDPLSHTHTHTHTPHTGGGPCFYYVRVMSNFSVLLFIIQSTVLCFERLDGHDSRRHAALSPPPTASTHHHRPTHATKDRYMDTPFTWTSTEHTSKHTTPASTHQQQAHQQQAHQQAHQPGTNEEEDGVGVEGGREARSHIGPYKYIIP